MTSQEVISFHYTTVRSLQKGAVTYLLLSPTPSPYFFLLLCFLFQVSQSLFTSSLLRKSTKHLSPGAFLLHYFQHEPEANGGFSSRICSLERSGWTGQASMVGGVLQFLFSLLSSEQHSYSYINKALIVCRGSKI